MTEKFTPAQMERLRNFLEYFLGQTLEPTFRELAVCSAVLHMFKMAYADHVPSEPLPRLIDASLSAVRDKPEFQSQIHEQYRVSLEKLFQLLTVEIPSSEDEGLVAWLEEWKSKGFLN